MKPIDNLQRGVTLVEMAIVIVVLFAVFSVLIQVSLYYLRYSLLSYTTTTVIRKVSVDVGAARCGSALKAEVKARAVQIVRDTLGFEPNDVGFEVDLTPLGEAADVASQRYGLKITGSWEAPAILKIIFPQGWKITSTNEAQIADECFNGAC